MMTSSKSPPPPVPDGQGDEFARPLARSIMAQALLPQQPATVAATVNFRQDNLIAIAVGLLSVAATVFTTTVCIAVVIIVAVMRAYDVDDMAQIRGRLLSCEQFNQIQNDRLTKLESEQVK